MTSSELQSQRSSSTSFNSKKSTATQMLQKRIEENNRLSAAAQNIERKEEENNNDMSIEEEVDDATRTNNDIAGDKKMITTLADDIIENVVEGESLVDERVIHENQQIVEQSEQSNIENAAKIIVDECSNNNEPQHVEEKVIEEEEIAAASEEVEEHMMISSVAHATSAVAVSNIVNYGSIDQIENDNAIMHIEEVQDEGEPQQQQSQPRLRPPVLENIEEEVIIHQQQHTPNTNNNQRRRILLVLILLILAAVGITLGIILSRNSNNNDNGTTAFIAAPGDESLDGEGGVEESYDIPSVAPSVTPSIPTTTSIGKDSENVPAVVESDTPTFMPTNEVSIVMKINLPEIATKYPTFMPTNEEIISIDSPTSRPITDKPTEQPTVILPKATWMSGKWGISWRFEAGNTKNMREYNVTNLVEQVQGINGLSYVLFGLSRGASGDRYIAPHSVLSELNPGCCPDRDLFEELATAFQAVGLKVLVYMATEGPAKLKHGKEKAYDWNGVTAPSVDNWYAYVKKRYGNKSLLSLKRAYADVIVKEYAERYGTLIDGWWFDHASYGHMRLIHDYCFEANENGRP